MQAGKVVYLENFDEFGLVLEEQEAGVEAQQLERPGIHTDLRGPAFLVNLRRKQSSKATVWHADMSSLRGS
jgi:hypothetical protein